MQRHEGAKTQEEGRNRATVLAVHDVGISALRSCALATLR